MRCSADHMFTTGVQFPPLRGRPGSIEGDECLDRTGILREDDG